MCSRQFPASGARREPGIALVAVLIALTLLMALIVPFTASMGFGSDAAMATADARTADLSAQSARDLLVGQAAMGHPSVDPTPTFDTRDEYADQVLLPEALAAMGGDGRVRLGGEVEDLQRRVHLDAATPLLLGNLIGTVGRLREALPAEASSIQLDGGVNLPEAGFVWIDHEVIHYAARSGGALSGLTRSLLQERGFVRAEDHEVNEGALVLDLRTVLAVSWPFDARTGGARQARRPFAGPRDLAEVGQAGMGAFTPAELDVFERTLTAAGGREQAPVWGRAERVFGALQPGARSLRVKSAVHVGPGSTVRLRHLRGGPVEYNLVMGAGTPRGQTDVQLPSEFRLDLLLPVAAEWPAFDTVVEPLVPPPVNVNTAGGDVLAALFAGNRRAQDVREHGADGRQRAQPSPAISDAEARALAESITSQRSLPPADDAGPFRNWRDLAERVWKPRLDEAPDFAQKNRWILLYRNVLTGRDSAIEMGTAPLCFASGPWVGYRGAASVSRSALSTGVSARSERTGVAIAIPGFPLDAQWRTQEALEEAFRFDQRAPYWITLPINTGATNPNEAGNDPASRFFPHLIGMAYPTAGLGQSRFPSTDTADSGFMLAPATTPTRRWQREPRGFEPFGTSNDPLGRDVSREGAYRVRNNGPQARGGQAEPAAGADGGGGDHSRISFPFTQDGGVAGRFAAQFWAEPESLGNQTLFEYGDGDRERNRIALEFRDGNLVLEALDEAGLDPEPGRSPTSPERTATEIRVPLTELNAQPRTWTHFNLSAYATRPTDLSLLVDGIPRGKPRYVTYLTAPLQVLDPQNQAPVAGNPVGSDPRFLDLYVEDTETFPPQGVVRIGLELFEYTSKSAGILHCRWADSRGGRVARQIFREFRPDIPTDAQGRPTVDIDNLPAGVNLDVAPDHPVGAMVELYGYSALPSVDSVMFVGDTQLASPVGAFAVGRGFANNTVPISIQVPRGPSIPIGDGIDTSGGTEIELADPLAGRNYPPAKAQQAIADAFPVNGGYALFVQRSFEFNFNQPGQLSGTPTLVGGVEVFKYARRDGTRLTGIQRAVTLPGNDSQINRNQFDGTARRFVMNWNSNFTVEIDGTRLTWNEVPVFMLFVVPISLAVQSTAMLPDPQTTGYTEWVQLYPGGDENDTEWVRYDAILDNQHLARTNRRAWDRTRYELTRQINQDQIGVGNLGVLLRDPTVANAAIWGNVTATTGYIGYVDKIEADWPMVRAARSALAFRGDPSTGTSSHAQQNCTVLPCHRLQLQWGNHGAYTGRVGRQDRVALVSGSSASGTARPSVEWHTVNWQMRRYGIDNTRNGNVPSELLGPAPFQLVGLKARVAKLIQGPASDLPPGTDPRLIDRLVKFPSGELPAAYAPEVPVGGGLGGDSMRGRLDEAGMHGQLAMDVTLEEPCDATATTLQTRPDLTIWPTGPVAFGGDLSAQFPAGGGLCMIDGEILAFQSRSNGQFQVAQNGRGMLGTTPRGHDRGARVLFLTHVPAAILAGGVQPRGESLPVQALGALPIRGTLLLGRELLHYTWTRGTGDQVSLEMPRYFPPGETPDEGSAGRGLFRGRYGTTPQGAGAGEAVVGMPFRFWDRFTEDADDPEMAPFQVTHVQAPVHWKTLHWVQETTDATVEVLCRVRIDGQGTFADDPMRTPGLYRFQQQAGQDRPVLLDRSGSQCEVRFYVRYRPGAYDPVAWRAHGWKSSPKVKDVRVDYEGQGQILTEQVSDR